MSEKPADALTLDGIRVLDLSTHAVGPFATQILAALGATVLKIERPPAGDPERTSEYAMFHACNQGKHSVMLDLQSARDREVVQQLVSETDVLVEGFRPEVARRLGLGFESVAERANRIVYVSLPGFGSTGPYAGERSYDVELRALAGELYLNRDAAGVPQWAHASPVFDYATAQYAVIGILAALMQSDRAAMHLEVPILAAGLAWTFARLSGQRRERAVEGQYVFRASDERYLTITAPVEQSFRALCQAIDKPDLADLPGAGAFSTRPPEVWEAIAAAIATRPRHEWLDVLHGAGVARAAILEPDEVFDDPQVAHLDVIGRLPQPWSKLPIFGLPAKRLSAPPSLGADTDAVRSGGWDALNDGQTARTV